MPFKDKLHIILPSYSFMISYKTEKNVDMKDRDIFTQGFTIFYDREGRISLSFMSTYETVFSLIP